MVRLSFLILIPMHVGSNLQFGWLVNMFLAPENYVPRRLVAGDLPAIRKSLPPVATLSYHLYGPKVQPHRPIKPQALSGHLKPTSF